MKLWKIMTSRIEFITRGVKIMARPNSASAKRAAANRERAKKVQAANKAKKTAALQRAKGSTKRVQQRRQTAGNKLKKPLTKPLTKSLNSRGSQRKPVNKTVKKSTNKPTFPTKKPTPKKLPGKLGKIAAGATALGAGALALMRRKDPTFGEAFKKARKEKGPNSTFNYKGKKYSTVTQDQVKKAGYSTLRQYLNAGGKKKTSVKKPMKRKTGPRNRR